MKNTDISEAMGYIDDELVIPVDEKRKEQLERKRKRPFWITAAAMAACLGIIVGTVAIRNLSGGSIPVESGVSVTSSPPSHSGEPVIGTTIDSTAITTSADKTTSASISTEPPATEPDIITTADTTVTSETTTASTTSAKETTAQSTEAPPDQPQEAVRALKMAFYPKAAPCPTFEDFYDDSANYGQSEYAAAHRAWGEDRSKRRNAAKGVSERYGGFYENAVRELLSGANGNNKVCSPVNLYMALAMLAETTDGESRAQLLDLLGAESIGELRELAERLWTACYINDGLNASILANSVWLDDKINYNDDVLSVLAENYFASSFGGDTASEEMSEMLRDWLNEQTNGLLKDAAQNARISPEALITLCSTVYFRAKWCPMFDESKNTVGVFHADDGDIETVFMNSEYSDGYCYFGEKFTAVQRRFDAQYGAMWFILPNEGVTIDEVLSSEEYAEITLKGTRKNYNEMSYDMIVLSVPKFDICSDSDISEELKALGITDVFDEQKADFSPLSDNSDGACLKEVHHAARVAIDEVGCTGAAFTIEQPGKEGGPPDIVYFTADRPFLFTVVSDTYQPLFTGIVNKP